MIGFARNSAFAAAAALVLLASPAAAQQRVEYEIAFPNAVHHEARVRAVFHGVAEGAPLRIRMSRASPGRYALHEFAKNVYDVAARDGAGRELSIARPNLHEWDVSSADGTVEFTYTLFGDHADGTYVGIDATHAHLNMPATFVYAVGFDSAPIEVRFRIPEGSDWRIATQLQTTADSSVFRAPHLQYFMDSPTEISAIDWHQWRPDSTHTIRLALHHLGTRGEADAFFENVKKIVAQERAIFGELPEYDFGTYTFLADYLPWVYGDGMEHRNSTVVIGTRPLATGAQLNLFTVAHEYFHSWNMERIRSAEIEPFDFADANMSRALWFGEGFTQYYTPLPLLRAGIIPLNAYLANLAGFINGVQLSPGNRRFSPVEMSMQAPFVDAAVSIDDTNRPNTFISYYAYGAELALGLDLMLRESYHTSLDAYMRRMWEKYGRAQRGYAPVRPYTLEDLQQTLAEVSGDADFARDFFARHITGREQIDFAPLLEPAGFLLRRANPGQARLTLGRVEYEDSIARVTYVIEGDPLYRAGIDKGDRLLTLDGTPLNSAADLQGALKAHAPGDVVHIAVETRTGARDVEVTLAEDPVMQVVPFEDAGRPLTKEAKAFRESWLGSKAP